MTEFSFSHVNKNFGFKPVLKDLSFEVMTGERAALIGRNGTGKSTILKLLASEESPDSGEISLAAVRTPRFWNRFPACAAKTQPCTTCFASRLRKFSPLKRSCANWKKR